ncbi:MAG: hypothetical protein IKJ63_02790 [Clostridia bacterium]|nr:hypothetical protein [Clostridia bacterium]
MKKIISVLLVFVLSFACVVPAFAEDTEHPTIYVTGAQTNALYYADGTQLYPLVDDVEAMDVIKEALVPCLKKLVKGMLTNDYKEYAQEFYNVFVPIYEDMALDVNGEVSDGSHPEYTIYNCNIPKKTSDYNEYDYRFWYDWRISPMVAADELKEWIDMVLEATGEKKVNLMGRCYGANVIAAYLTKYEDHALETVDDVAYLSSSVIGIDMLTALFTGNIRLDGDAIDNFLNYYMDKENLIEDAELNLFLVTALALFREIKTLDLTGAMLELLISRLKSDLIPPLLRDTFGSMPSYWSMVNPESYEQAREFVFADCKDTYAKLIEKTDDFHYNVQADVEEKMLEFDEKGIDFYILVKYNFPDYPIYSGAACLGDGNTSCVRQAFGGEYADYGTVFSQDYIDSLEDTTYLSADLKINAATCLFPETTWFIKNMHHDIFPNSINRLAMDVMNNEAVVSDGRYPAFTEFVDNRLIPVETTDEDAVPEQKNILKLILDFFKSLIEVMKKLFNGEIAL